MSSKQPPLKSIFTAFMSLTFLILSTFARAQAIDPQRSARAAATSDNQFISSSIADNEDVMFLSQQAREHATDERVKELAEQMQENHGGMMYSLEQLQNAGTGSAKKGNTEITREQAAAVNKKLATVSGAEFDSVWVANLLIMQQAKLDELTQAKESVTNPQLRTAITDALPLVRKEVSQLKSIQKYLIKIAIQKKKEEEAARKARK